jgi:glycosyltransferase involved in cell wall biosynthesis
MGNEQPIRVGILTYAMHGGGVEAYIIRLGRYLQSRGFPVEVITVEEAGNSFGDLAKAGIPATSLPPRRRWVPGYPLWHCYTVSRFLNRRAFDVILLNNVRYVQAALGMLDPRQARIIVVHNDHDSIYRVGLANVNRWNVAVAVSPKVLRGMQQRAPQARCELICNGVDVPEERVFANRRPHERPLRLLSLGRLEQVQKNIYVLPPILAECVRRGMDVTLTIVGDGPDRAQLQDLCAREPALAGRVTFTGKIPLEQAYELYRTHHVLLLPSFYEGLPTTPIEAQANGCVPICSFLEGITDEAVADGETGLLVPREPIDHFVAAIARLYHDAEEWARLSTAGRERTRKLFSIEAMGEQYVRLMQSTRAGNYPLRQPQRRWWSVNLQALDWPPRPGKIFHKLMRLFSR